MANIDETMYFIESGMIEEHLEKLSYLNSANTDATANANANTDANVCKKFKYNSITFCEEYDNPIHSLPDNIMNIIIEKDYNYNYKCINKIQYPPNLEYLELMCFRIYNKNFIENISKYIDIPNTIKKIKICINNDLFYREMQDKIYTTIENYIPKNIPEIDTNFPIDYTKFTNLKSLTISDKEFNQPLNNLPIGLEELHINSLEFNHSLDNLPSTLKILEFSQNRIIHIIMVINII